MRELNKRNRLLEQENEILRRGAACPARDINPMIYPLVTDPAAEGIPVVVTLHGFEVQQARLLPVGSEPGPPP